jgi:WD40 repeat protein
LTSVSLRSETTTYYLYSTGADKKVNVWTYDTSKDTLDSSLYGQTDVVTDIILSFDCCTCLAGSTYDKTIILWDLDTGKIMKTLTGNSNKVLDLTNALVNQTLISGDADGLIITRS